MLAARLEAPARMAGLDLEAVASKAELEDALQREEPDVALIDCADGGFPFAETHAAIRRLAPEARCIAIYPHVRAELAKMARDAGCELVLPRSRFFTDIAGSLNAAMSATLQAGARGRV